MILGIVRCYISHMVKYDYINYVYDQVFHNMSLLSVNDTACIRNYSFCRMNKVENETSGNRSVNVEYD